MDSLFSPPEMISSIDLEYPEEALKKKEDGAIAVLALVEKDGTVSEASLWYSSGSRILDSLAVKTAYLNKYKPAKYNDTALVTYVTYFVRFVR
jgi:TonB family protein